MTHTCIVIGASHAGVQAVDSLRREGFEGRIVLVGEEPHWPYQRPPLSKKFLLGELSVERLAIRQPQVYDQHRVEVRLATRVTAVDAKSQTITLADREVLSYDYLILCVGSRVRTLACPGADLMGVHYLRTMDDVLRIQSELSAAKCMVVIGAGYIGLETAASAIKHRVEVTVLEMADRCLNRVTSPVVSDFYARRHAEAGVKLLTNTRVSQLIGDERVGDKTVGNNQVRAVRCADGRELPADIVVVGVGIVPEIALAQGAGLACDNGIVVDEHCRTSDPRVFAAGDCTNHPSIRYGGRARLESVDNAVEQARVAAATICGKDLRHAHTPWFWSDQYDVKLQTAGLLQNYDQHIVRGDPFSNQFSVWYLKQGELLAVDAINRPADFITGKRWIGERKFPDVGKLADLTVDLKNM